jgi:hypothetical protein
MNPVAVSGWILNLADGRIFTISMVRLFLFFMSVGRFYSFLLCAVLQGPRHWSCQGARRNQAGLDDRRTDGDMI